MKLRAAPFVACAVAVALLACSDKKKTATNAGTQPSPNASLLPAPLASTSELPGPQGAHSAVGIPADSAGRLIVREPEPPPPEVAAVDRALSEDSLTSKDGSGFTLEAAFKWPDAPPPSTGPEVAAGALRDAAAKTEFSVTVDLASVGRLRFALESPAFPLPAHTELRSRTQNYGHVLVWPSGSAYRVLAPGSLRAMFAERRADVTPVLRAKVKSLEPGSLLGHKTVRSDVETTLGTVTLEQASIPGSGTGGELLCRLLIEFVGADPTTEVCHGERIPLAARYRWAGGGGIVFVATSLSDRKDLPLGYLYVPPAGAGFLPGELPPTSAGVFLTKDDLTRFRTRAVTGLTPGPRAPGEGVTADNQTSLLQYLLIDGVPVAWIPPKSQRYVIGPQSGRYSVAFRDFLGTSITPPSPTELPAFVRLGTPDGDAGTH